MEEGGEVMEKEKKKDALTTEINVMYTMAMAMDRIMLDFERRMYARKDEFIREKKIEFKKIINCAQGAYRAFSVLNDDIERSSADSGYKDLDTWSDEALEYARLLLLYDDKCGRSLTNRDQLFSYIRSLKGEDVITEDVLKRFYLKK